ncbi:MAG: MBL fold metallo-hydrolase [Gemmatimonadales bacterium]|nr:MAG: MBL fold metallo-hydrolase [Gemmatimonadales bacterium]
MHILPLGGAGTVTGSRFLVDAGRTRVLVDCGLFQGLKNLRLRNWRPFPMDPADLDAVVLTHAHLDHSGYLPVLVREGFRGPVHVTPPTEGLLPILLADAGRLQEEDASFARRKGFSRHDPPRPLFTARDAWRAVEQVEPIPFGDSFQIGSLSLEFHRAGHILGAGSVRVVHRSRGSVLFSGDLGRPNDLLLPAPAARPEADRIVMESTYGDREHEEVDSLSHLAGVVNRVAARGGVILIPTFALGRAQTLAVALWRLRQEGRIPHLPMFLDSPMAVEVSGVHQEHVTELRVPGPELAAALEAVQPVVSVEDSKAIHGMNGPRIILAGAGMLTGGRILHHLVHFGDEPRHALLLAGFQAEGTRGRALVRGDRTLRIHGTDVPIRLEVERIEAFSGHAGRSELLAWLRTGPPAAVSLVHGEPGPADTLRRTIGTELGWEAEVAEEGQPLGEAFLKTFQ